MFTTFIVRPIFNLLTLIYALIPGHNFGLSIILFTVVIRMLMWPLVKKQLHHTKAMRELQPEIKRIKKVSKGNRQQESKMLMELYKERNINPFASLGLVVVQLPILIGLYSGIRRVITSHEALVSFSYSPIRNLGWMRQLASNIHLFDGSLFGIVDLTRSALDKTGKTYWPAMIIVIASSVVQFYQSKQLMPDDKQSRSLKTILKESRSGKQSDQTEVNAAVGRSTRYFIPVMIFLFTVNIASALSLYFLVSGLVAYAQQKKVLDQDSVEMETVPKATSKQEVIEGEVINSKTNNNKQSKRTPKNKKRKKR